MNLLQTYLEKHAAGDNLIPAEPQKGLKLIIVIPAYLETSLEESLVSLFNTSPPASAAEIIVVINWPDDADMENIRISREILNSVRIWMEKHSSPEMSFYAVEAGNIPRKKAGVGYARKTGMDEAIRRFLRAGQDDGVIISFDADTRCDTNYLTSIEEHFLVSPYIDGCSVYFEHPLEGKEFSEEVYKAIVEYELHMRYYLHSVKYSGFPNAFYTVGSAFAVRAASYCRQGGMNIRQAGEDFYFLQKFFDLGNFSDLLKTRVCPSPRPSQRVPFGTGKAVNQLINSQESLNSYNPAIFDILKEFFNSVPLFYKQLSATEKPILSSLNPILLEFLENSGFPEALHDIFRNSGSQSAFTKRFYRYFNMFRILKFAKHARKKFPDLPVGTCARTFLQKTVMTTIQYTSEKEILLKFREMDLHI